MPRLPYAAKVLLSEARELSPDLTYETVDEPDGFGVWRTIKFDKATSALLADPMRFLEDNRVSSVNTTGAGYLHVTFRPESIYADRRDPFMLRVARDVLAEQEDPQPIEDTQPVEDDSSE